MQDSGDKWKTRAEEDTRLHPLPHHIICILQIKKFESWLISDLDGLKSARLIDKKIEKIDDAEQIADPEKWLKENLLVAGCVKSPRVAKIITSALNPDQMRLHSRSFDKFYRESKSFYNEWLEKIK